MAFRSGTVDRRAPRPGTEPRALVRPEADLANAILRSLRKLHNAISDADLEAVLRRRSDPATMLPWDVFDAKLVADGLDPLTEAWQLGMRAGAAQLPDPGIVERSAVAKQSGEFDPLRGDEPRATRNVKALLADFRESAVFAEVRAERHIRAVAVNIQDSTASGIHNIVRRHVSGELTLDQAQRRIRQAGLGLHPRYEQAVHNRWQATVDRLARQHPNWKRSTIVGRANARSREYAAQLRRSRALTVSRTETARAVNGGKVEAWEAAFDAGELDFEPWKEWHGPNAVDFCLDLDGERVPLNATFDSGDYHPPAHPNCGCHVSLEPPPAAGRRR